MTSTWHGIWAQFALAREGNPRQGRMTSYRALTTTATLLALALSAAAPAAASADPLLSGYGGPGQGNQAILGSALLNGPPGGGEGGGGSAGAGGSPTSGGPTGGVTGAPAAAATPGHASSAAGNGSQATERAGKASGNGSQTYSYPSGLAASRAALGGSQTLGLTGTDLMYILLALGALGLTGALTSQLARRPR
jgi:hypothetical protein